MKQIVVALFFILIPSAFGLAKTPSTAVLEVYLGGEKPGLSEPLGAQAPIHIEMAKGEFETLLFRLRGDRGAASDRDPLIQDLKVNWKGKPPGETKLSIYWVGVHRLTGSSFQAGGLAPGREVVDMVIPMEWVQKKWIQVPPENQPTDPTALVEIHVPRSAPAGEWQGRLEFRWGGQTFQRELSLKIHGVTLPDSFSMKTSFGFAPWPVLKKHYGAWNKNEMSLYRQYEDLAQEHRIDLHKIYVKFPALTAKDPLLEALVPEQSYMAQTKPLFAGARSERGHRMSVTDLPVPEEMKSKQKTPQLEKSREVFWRNLDRSVKAKGLEEQTFVYFVDEPKPPTLKKIGQDLKQIRQWAPHLRFLGTTHHAADLEDSFNLWCINLFQWDKPGFKTPEFYQKRVREKNDRLWLYVGCNSHGCEGAEDISNPDLVIDRPSAYQRSFPWMGLRYAAQGILYYDTVYGYSKAEDSPWKDGFHFTGFGEGNLFYPCTSSLGKCDRPRVIPSLRLKILRDGLEDVQILEMARERGLPVETWVKEMIPHVRQFPKSIRVYEELKRRALREMSALPAPTS